MSNKDNPFKRTVLVGETPDGERLLNDAPPKCVKNPLKTSCEIDPDWAADKIKQQQETIERLREALQKIYDLEGDIRPEYAAPLFASIHRTAKQALLQEQGSDKSE